MLAKAVLKTIQQLHATGGPYRLNLPKTLRSLDPHVPPDLQQDVAFVTTARQMLANYHRRLRDEWSKVIASNETLGLTIRLGRQTIRCEAMIDRVDQEVDGGVTAVEFIMTTEALPDDLSLDDVETTLRHALVAAAYPNKRPVRIKQLWLYHNRDLSLELTEKHYRQNLSQIKERMQTWLEGEVLARPGLHCDFCPFQDYGCPIYISD